jgi:general secretion pathway protein D
LDDGVGLDQQRCRHQRVWVCSTQRPAVRRTRNPDEPVNSNGKYRIVAADQAIVGIRIRTDDSPDPEQIGSGLQVVQLKYVSASEIRRVLDTIAPRGGIVRTDDARNLITLSGNRQDIATMMEAIALFDIDTMKGMSFALVPVKTSQPDAIAGSPAS